jgi:hypothetical protein
MAVRRSKPLKASPVFEKLNQERLTECRKTVQSARQAIEASKKHRRSPGTDPKPAIQAQEGRIEVIGM